MSNTEKFLQLFADFDMQVVEKTEQITKKTTKCNININANQTKSELKKALKRLTEELSFSKFKKSAYCLHLKVFFGLKYFDIFT